MTAEELGWIEKDEPLPQTLPWSTYGKKIVLEEMKGWGLEADRSDFRLGDSRMAS